ncbi:GMC oxidoreductase [Trametes polyzona]|nr:GMC oxidoreductase [Trametes polyzona]
MTAGIIAEQFSSIKFDYIIVGGGTAGLVLAARLSEDPSTNVGVIEAGSWDPNVPAINVPGLCGSILGNPEYDWAFMSVPQKHANNRAVFQPRGKALGGSSMVAIEALGNPGWNWDGFLKYFKKSETTLPTAPDAAKAYGLASPDSQYHGDSGPIVKGYPTWFNPLHVPFLETLEKLGVPRNPDPDNGNNMGAVTSFVAVDSRTATRSYAANAYYEPNSSRKNLVVLTNATVSKINFRPGSSPLVATSVEFLHSGQKYIAAARKEVILAAGSFQTPQLLELSGIGNRELLNKRGVQTLVDLPSDHVYVYSIHEIDPQYETVDFARDPEEAVRQQELYKSGKGYLTSALASLFGFVPAKTFATEDQLRDWKARALATVQDVPDGLKKQLELQIQWFLDPNSAEAELLPFPGFFLGSPVKPEPNTRYSSMVSTILHPLSRGSVHISSADPMAAPAIDPNYFSNPLDLEMLTALLKSTLKLYETSPFGDPVRKQVAPTPEVAASDDALKEYIKDNCGCVYHPLGTASMLPREDGGVVDPQLRVYGTANVRVVSHVSHPTQALSPTARRVK